MYLCDESIDLWTIPLTNIGDRFQDHEQSLSADERQRAVTLSKRFQTPHGDSPWHAAVCVRFSVNILEHRQILSNSLMVPTANHA